MLAKIPGFESNPDAAAVTAAVRQALIDLYEQEGGIHMQIGKSYPYRSGLQGDAYSMIEQIKKILDPDGRVNPGALGLD